MAGLAFVRAITSNARHATRLSERHFMHIAAFETSLSSANFVCWFLPFANFLRKYSSLDYLI